MTSATPSFRSWLPTAAIDRGARDVPVGRAVEDWSAKWFARGQVAVIGDPGARGTPGESGTGAGWALADGVTLTLAATAGEMLADLLFGPPDDGTVLTAADTAALDRVTGTCLADLRARLATALRLPADAPWRPALDVADLATCRVWRAGAVRGAVLFEVALDETLIIEHLRGTLPPRSPAPALAALAAALADRAVGISALVGQCRLTTAELAGLASGDVVVLDRALTGSAALVVDGAAQRRACTVTEDDGHLVLTLCDDGKSSDRA